MSKLTLDMNTFKALASDTRLDILRALDGKKLSLNDICKATNLNKATLHEHLIKLNEAGLVKKNEREGHKWVYYKLTWKGEGLLHPENTRIVVMFSSTFISLLIAVILIVNFLQPIPIGIAETINDTTYLYEVESAGIPILGEKSYNFRYLAEVDAREKTVENITVTLQQNALPTNSIGYTYDQADIVWFNIESANIQNFDDACGDKYILSAEQSNQKLKIETDCAHIPNQQNMVYVIFEEKYMFNNDTNISAKKTLKGNSTEGNETNVSPNDEFVRDENETNETTLGFEYGEGSLHFYPAVPTMIATVQDTTLLYLAVACLTFFTTLFTISLWRFKVNKKPKL
jgi:DNA-binding transcriptional ArsR family regulator